MRERAIGDRGLFAKNVSTAQGNTSLPRRVVGKLEIVIHHGIHLRIGEQIIARLNLTARDEAAHETAFDIGEGRHVSDRPNRAKVAVLPSGLQIDAIFKVRRTRILAHTINTIRLTRKEPRPIEFELESSVRIGVEPITCTNVNSIRHRFVHIESCSANRRDYAIRRALDERAEIGLVTHGVTAREDGSRAEGANRIGQLYLPIVYRDIEPFKIRRAVDQTRRKVLAVFRLQAERIAAE